MFAGHVSALQFDWRLDPDSIVEVASFSATLPVYAGGKLSHRRLRFYIPNSFYRDTSEDVGDENRNI